MASPLLSCSICPKRPNFSDTSHLLTHVGSKGHLAHLHKLQVRSHQEIAAGHQLAAYNQWYQQHGLGQLLSERLQQKDSKLAVKRRRNSQAAGTVKYEQVVAYGDAANFALVSPSRIKVNAAPRRRRARLSRHYKRRTTPESDSDYESSPIKRNRRRRGRMLYSSPIKGTGSEGGKNSSDDDCPAEDDPQPPCTPENAKLKGVIWPGMHLFDAATAEMRRKRNQKKDGSVLKKMERTSAMIEPTEVIYSPGGTMRKERYIDGNADDSSPLEGETPIPKTSARRKRQPLAVVSANVSRHAKPQPQGAKFNQPKLRDPTPSFRSRLQNIPSSSTNMSFETSSRFSPTQDENMEFKLTIGAMTNRKRRGHFTVFNESEDYFPQTMLPAIKSENVIQAPRSNHVQVHTVPAIPQLSFLTAPWLQPQYQMPVYYNNSYMEYKPSSTPFRPFHEASNGKENTEWSTADPNYAAETFAANPLGFQWSEPGADPGLHREVTPIHVRRNVFGEAVSQFEDSFTYGKNPLSAAFGQFDGPFVSSSEGRQHRNLSPDGTISDHEDHGCQL